MKAELPFNRRAVRQCFSVILTIILFCASALTGYGANNCNPSGICLAYISKQLVPVIAQQTPVWCWAASLSMLYGYFGHPVDQSRIVERYYLLPLPVTGQPLIMDDALNTDWVDDNGKSFHIVSRITDLYQFTRTQINNNDIINALVAETPVYYGDYTHAMVLVQAQYYYPAPGQPFIFAGWVIDPWPATLGFRQLQPNELQALYAAIPTVTDLNSSSPVITSVSNSASGDHVIAGQTFATIYGKNLSSVTTGWDNFIRNGVLPTTIMNTKVLVNGASAYLSYVSPGQVNFIVPSGITTGTVTVSVTTPSGTSATQINLKTQAPALFTYASGGRAYAIASVGSTLLGPVGAASPSTRPAHRNEDITLWVNGFGSTTPAAPDGVVLQSAYPLQMNLSSINVSFGGVTVHPTFAGLTFAGLYQVNVRVPANAPIGDTPLTVQVGSDTTLSGIFTTVQP